MKYISIAALTLLGSCSSLPSILTPGQMAIVDQVQAGAIKACSFAPTVEGVLALVAPNFGVDAVINAICAAIPQPVATTRGVVPAPRAGQPGEVIVNGTVVKGTYTK